MSEHAETVAAPVTADSMTAWLLEVGAAEEDRGYGHFSAGDLAHLMLSVFDIRRTKYVARKRPSEQYDGSSDG